MIVTSHIHLLIFKVIKIKINSANTNSYISVPQFVTCTHGYYGCKHRYRTFSSTQKDSLNSFVSRNYIYRQKYTLCGLG